MRVAWTAFTPAARCFLFRITALRFYFFSSHPLPAFPLARTVAPELLCRSSGKPLGLLVQKMFF
jgi:hypothetical protein